MGSLSVTEGGVGEVGCDEIQRAKGMGGGEVWVLVCPR